ncbi:hypothetical protein TNCV_1949801 [Trichonephila clavipes]|nr:hypothetical protein TNCV_1949801 [Trichonephila clavipes]
MQAVMPTYGSLDILEDFGRLSKSLSNYCNASKQHSVPAFRRIARHHCKRNHMCCGVNDSLNERHECRSSAFCRRIMVWVDIGTKGCPAYTTKGRHKWLVGPPRFVDVFVGSTCADISLTVSH